MFARVRLFLPNSSWCNGVGRGYRRRVLSPPLPNADRSGYVAMR